MHNSIGQTAVQNRVTHAMQSIKHCLPPLPPILPCGPPSSDLTSQVCKTCGHIYAALLLSVSSQKSGRAELASMLTYKTIWGLGDCSLNEELDARRIGEGKRHIPRIITFWAE